MRTGLAPRVCWVLALGFVTAIGLEANPLTAPRRLINGRIVDLAPLFRWWTNHAGARPLSAWMRVTGSVIATNAWGWIVEGQIEHTAATAKAGDSGGGKVLLKNPPLQEQAEFEQLSAQLKALNEQRTNLQTEAAQARNREDALAREQRANRRYGVRSRVLTLENRQVKLIENQVRDQLKPLDRQIQALKAKLAAYPSSDHYVVDCVALRTGQSYGPMPVFDHGQIFQ